MLDAEFINRYCELLSKPHGLSHANLRIVARPNLIEGQCSQDYYGK